MEPGLKGAVLGGSFVVFVFRTTAAMVGTNHRAVLSGIRSLEFDLKPFRAGTRTIPRGAVRPSMEV